jgi:hypothetical protein
MLAKAPLLASVTLILLATAVGCKGSGSGGSGSGSPASPDTPTYVPPTVTAISPDSGPATGGTKVTITGTGFNTGATVLFGGTAATDVRVVTTTTVTATTPARQVGPAQVQVWNPNNQGGGLCCFTFVAP